MFIFDNSKCFNTTIRPLAELTKTISTKKDHLGCVQKRYIREKISVKVNVTSRNHKDVNIIIY